MVGNRAPGLTQKRTDRGQATVKVGVVVPTGFEPVFKP